MQLFIELSVMGSGNNNKLIYFATFWEDASLSSPSQALGIVTCGDFNKSNEPKKIENKKVSMEGNYEVYQ